MKHKVKIYKTMIQLRMIFSTIAFYYECYESGRKKGEGEWQVTLNQRDSLSFPDTCHACYKHSDKIALKSLVVVCF